jgi:PAS domain S-box-containing protein
LKRQKVILQTVFDHIPVMINFVDPAGRVQLVNRHWERVLGWSFEEAQTHDLFSECHPDPTERARPMEYLRHPSPGWKDFKNRVRDGRMLDTSWALTVLPDGTRIGFGQDITERRQAERALQEYAARLQTLSRRLLEVQEEERRHLARELHDEVGQILTGLRLILKPTGHLTPDTAKAGFEQARTLVDGLLETVRHLSFDLRPAALDQLGLLPGLLALFDRYTRQSGVLVTFKHQGVDRRFAPDAETTAYRIAQEALTNVARHAGVAGVCVRVWAGADTLNIQVEDRGRGFDREAVLATPRSCGLPGMQERVTLLGGHLTIESRPGAGTQITAELPLPKAGAGGTCAS